MLVKGGTTSRELVKGVGAWGRDLKEAAPFRNAGNMARMLLKTGGVTVQ